MERTIADENARTLDEAIRSGDYVDLKTDGRESWLDKHDIGHQGDAIYVLRAFSSTMSC